jgi:PAS domain S-box-containing protein
MRIRSKLFLSYVLLVGVSIGILTAIFALESTRKIQEEAGEAMGRHLEAAWKHYYVRAEQMRLGMLQAASTEELREAITAEDTAFLRQRLAAWKGYRPYVDFWLVTDSSGRVLARLVPGHGDRVSFNGLLDEAVKTRQPVVATVGIGMEELLREGLEVDEGSLVNGRGMAVAVATPVLDGGEVVGVVVTGDLLNGDPYLAEELEDVLWGMRAGLLQGGVVVSASGGSPLSLGARMPLEIALEPEPGWVTLEGESWLMAADAIRDNRGEVLGAVFLGAPEGVLFAHLEEHKDALVITAVLTLFFGLVLALISTEEISAPLVRLAEAARRIRRGELGVTVKADRLYGRDEIGELTRVFNTMSRELKSSYTGLREALEYNQSIISNAPIGIFTTDMKGRITSANPELAKMMGWKNTEQGIGLDLLSIPLIREKGWDRLLKKALRGEPMELYGEEYISLAGKRVWINLRAVPLRDNGEIKGLLILVEDITEQIEAEERVREMSQFPERNPNPVFKVSVSGEILYHNPGVFNYVESDRELDKLLPQGYADLVKTACRTGEEARVEHSCSGRSLDYIIYPVSSSAAHVYGRDITERKRYEEELHKRIRELERMHRIMVGRELRMKELKEKIRELQEELRRGHGR